MYRPFYCLALCATFAAAFTLHHVPHRSSSRSTVSTQALEPQAELTFDKVGLLQAAALAPVLAAAPASAFSSDYLPALLVRITASCAVSLLRLCAHRLSPITQVPVMTLFLPAMGMALGFILITRDEL